MQKTTLNRVIEQFHRSHGIYLEGDKVYICRIKYDVKGAEIEKETDGPVGDKPLSDYLKETFPKAKPVAKDEEPETPQQRREKAAIKIPLRKRIKEFIDDLPEVMVAAVKDTGVFYYAFPTSFKPGKTLDVDAIISENPRAEFLHSPTIIYDWLSTQFGDQIYTLMCVAQKKTVQDLWTDFDNLNLRPLRIEAAPWAALRAAWNVQSPSQKSPEIRLLIGPEMILVAVTSGSTPLAWQLVKTEGDDLFKIIFPVVQSMIIYIQRSFAFPNPPLIIIQGENIPPETAEHLHTDTALECKIIKGRKYDGHLIAFGLALGGLDVEAKTTNLGRSIQKPISLLLTFPYMEAIIGTLLVAITLLVLVAQADKISTSVRIQQALNAQTLWAQGQDNDTISSNNNTIKKSIAPLEAFYIGVNPWADIMSEVSNLMPPTVKVTNITVQDPSWLKPKDKVSLVLDILVQSDGKTNPELIIDKFMSDIKNDKLISKYFKKVTLNSISLVKENNSLQANALQAIITIN